MFNLALEPLSACPSVSLAAQRKQQDRALLIACLLAYGGSIDGNLLATRESPLLSGPSFCLPGKVFPRNDSSPQSPSHNVIPDLQAAHCCSRFCCSMQLCSRQWNLHDKLGNMSSGCLSREGSDGDLIASWRPRPGGLKLFLRQFPVRCNVLLTASDYCDVSQISEHHVQPRPVEQ